MSLRKAFKLGGSKRGSVDLHTVSGYNLAVVASDVGGMSKIGADMDLNNTGNNNDSIGDMSNGSIASNSNISNSSKSTVNVCGNDNASGFDFMISCYDDIGSTRMANEDVIFIADSRVESQYPPNVALLLCLDGHGGREAAEFAARTIPDEALKSKHLFTNPQKALYKSFMKVDKTFPSLQSGTTATALLLFGIGIEMRSLPASGATSPMLIPSSNRNSKSMSVESSPGVSPPTTPTSRRGNGGSSSSSATSSTTSSSANTSMSTNGASNNVGGGGSFRDRGGSMRDKARNSVSNIFGSLRSSSSANNLLGLNSSSTPTLVVCSSGDSRAVLCKGYNAVDLTQDHRPNVSSESTRVLKAGSRITIDPISGGHYLDSQIAVTRSLGDLGLKNNIKGLIPDPETSVHELESNDYFVICATDGVWDVFTSEEAVAFVLAILMKNITKEIADEYGDQVQRERQGDALTQSALNSAAFQLVKAAISRGSSDNCSVIIFSINPNF